LGLPVNIAIAPEKLENAAAAVAVEIARRKLG